MQQHAGRRSHRGCRLGERVVVPQAVEQPVYREQPDLRNAIRRLIDSTFHRDRNVPDAGALAAS